MDFDALYKRYRAPIFRLALRLTRDPETAMDAVQETFAKAFQARASFRNEAAPSTWLYRIAYNACIARLEVRRRHLGLEGIDRPDSLRSRPESVAERQDSDAHVRLALASLGEDDRRLLCLQMERELDYQDLAAIFDCSAEAVRARVSRARRRLKEILEPLLGTTI